MSEIEELFNEMIESLSPDLTPIIVKLGDLRYITRDIEAKVKEAQKKFIGTKLAPGSFEEVVKKYDQILNQAQEKRKEVERLQQKHMEAFDEALKFSKNKAEAIFKKIIKALKSDKGEKYYPNLIYSGEGDYKGYSLLHFISGKFGGITAEILSCFRPEDIKKVPGVKSELMIAIESRNTEAINWLLENDTNLNHQNASGSTALHISCREKDYHTTKRLLEKRANPNITNLYGHTPLFDLVDKYALTSEINEELLVNFLHLLKDYGANFNLKKGEAHGGFVVGIREDISLRDVVPVSVADMYSKAEYDYDNENYYTKHEKVARDVGNQALKRAKLLNEFIPQDVLRINLAALCKAHKTLIQFAKKQNYFEQKALEDHSDASDQPQSVIANKTITAIQLLHDSIHSVTNIPYALNDPLISVILDNFTNSADIISTEQLQTPLVSQELDAALVLVGMNSSNEASMDLSG
ncbi:hypothetical protein phytr_2790 [Candidatus Phycorickettsia trachydisci]|uniref:Uncharacterized protein n=1 Tax=Candidatus Phycorickettsia trachydisci TaxID=2115978 RepID=A0A2P1P7L7_9RICK|nr:ankyrin repeat domain-containing protein [Candidatus Phycorickettsia trachydisci]AVP87235.1 hypothetical protein phytr_2790 [Candidatus Phycorickettsia trachydisci]